MIPRARHVAPILVQAALACAWAWAVPACAPREGDPRDGAPPLARIELAVDGMTCGGCEELVRQRVEALPGVQACDADHEARKVVLELDPARTSAAAVAEEIRAAGFEVHTP